MVLIDQKLSTAGPIMMKTLIPTYALYGEYLEESHEDVLHFENLRDRSFEHNWSIQPHKHDTFWQIFYLRNPGILMQLDHEEFLTTCPVFISIPPLFVHAFQYPSFAAGTVVSIRLPVISKVLGDLPDGDILQQRIWVIKESDPEFQAMFLANESIKSSSQKIDPLRHRGMEISLELLFLAFIRHASSSRRLDPLQLTSHNDELLRSFCNLIEDNFQSSWPVSKYAEELNISSVSLTRKCRAIIGTSPQKLLIKRRILEAKRMLQFTQLSISDISEQLGVVDTSYFCRLFKRETGCTPAAYRREKAI